MKQGGGAAPAGWPASGTITYENVTASYRPGLPPVLSNLSFTIQVSQHMPESACVMTSSMINTVVVLVIGAIKSGLCAQHNPANPFLRLQASVASFVCAFS